MRKFFSKFFMEISTIIIIFSISFFIRSFWATNYVGQDEGYYIHFVYSIIHNTTLTNFYPLRTCAFCFWPVFLLPLIQIVGFSERYIHIFSAFVGSIGVIAVYLIGKKLFNPYVGVLASLFLTFSYTHWFFSSFAQADVPGALFSISAIYFFWAGYKQKNSKYLLLGSVFTLLSEGTRYSIFPAVGFFLYLFLFDKKTLKNKRILFFILFPLILYGVGLLYDYLSFHSFFNSFISYMTDAGTPDSFPFYYFFDLTYGQYLMPALTFFVLFVSLMMILKNHALSKKRRKYSFLTFALLAFALSMVFNIPSFIRAVIGFTSLAVLFFYYFRSNGFNRYLIIYMSLVLIFFSAFSVKWDRYMTLLLPALYLLVAQLFYEVRKGKVLFFASALVFVLFVVYNFIGTVDNFLVNQQSTETRFHFQQQILNSSTCTLVFARRPSNYYYLYDIRINLPSTLNGFISSIKSNCNCPPRFILIDGSQPGVDYLTSDMIDKKQIFNVTFENSLIQDRRFYTLTTMYSINDDYIKHICSNQSI